MAFLNHHTSGGFSCQIHPVNGRVLRRSPFFCARSALMGTNDGAIDHLDFPIHMASMVGTFLDTGEYLGPDPMLLPAVEPGTHRFPVAIAFGKVAPCASRALDPEDAIQDGPVIQGRPTRARSLWWEQWSQLAPLLVCQFITSNHTSFYRVEGGLQTQPGPTSAARTSPSHFLKHPRAGHPEQRRKPP